MLFAAQVGRLFARWCADGESAGAAERDLKPLTDTFPSCWLVAGRACRSAVCVLDGESYRRAHREVTGSTSTRSLLRIHPAARA